MGCWVLRLVLCATAASARGQSREARTPAALCRSQRKTAAYILCQPGGVNSRWVIPGWCKPTHAWYFSGLGTFRLSWCCAKRGGSRWSPCCGFSTSARGGGSGAGARSRETEGLGAGGLPFRSQKASITQLRSMTNCHRKSVEKLLFPFLAVLLPPRGDPASAANTLPRHEH